MRYQTVIFDMDGTLVDTSPGVLGCFQKTVEKMGLTPLAKEEEFKVLGPSLHDSYTQLFGLDKEGAAQAIELYRKEYASWGLEASRLFDGIEPLLRDLKRRGVQLAVATSKAMPFALQMLKNKGLAQYFDVVQAPGLGETSGEKHGLIRAAMEQTKGPHLMLGDRVYDVEGAKKNGIDCAYALYGFGNEEEAAACAPTFCVSHPDEVYGLVFGRGLFITLEGGDGVGKTTQFARIERFLQDEGFRVVSTREPGGTPAAERIRQVILDAELSMTATTEAMLYAAARAEHVASKIRPAVERGAIVLCDRFLDSSIAYQVYGRGLDEEMVLGINRHATGGLAPDRTYLLCLGLESSKAREEKRGTQADRLELEGDDFKRRVREGYEKIAQANPERVRKIPADEGIEQVFARIRADLSGLLVQLQN